jgi:type IV pilus assembly protein PilC
MLNKISKFYAREVDSLVANLVELIQPILIVAIGVFVGLLFASVLMPIYNLTQSIGSRGI